VILQGIASAPRALYNRTMIFHVTMEQSDGWYVVECPALPGCVSQGRDEKEALDNVKEAIVGWLWAEDQKAAAKLSDADRIVVAI
jgi:predicted RNase H-like HicB family nuclease